MATASGGDGARARPPADAPAAATDAQAEPHGRGKRKGEQLALNSEEGEASSSSGSGADPFEAVAQQEKQVKVTGRIGDPWSHGETYGPGFKLGESAGTMVLATDSSSSSASLEVLQKMTVDQEVIEQKRAVQLAELLALKHRELALKEKQLELQREQLASIKGDEEERIMMLDLDKGNYSDLQHEYFNILKMEILKKRRNQGGSSGAD